MPDLPVSLEVAPALKSSAESQVPLLTEAIQSLLTSLGLPGRPSVRVDVYDDVSAPLRLRVNGRLCRVHEDAFGEWKAGYAREFPSPEDSEAKVSIWLQRSPAESASRFITFAAGEILKLQPASLLSESSLDACCAEVLATLPDAASATAIRPSLVWALEHGLSLTDKARVAAVFDTSTQKGSEPWETGEALISALQPDTIEIRLGPDLLRELTEVDSREEKGFAVLRDGLFQELGLVLPPLRFITDETLQAGCFAFRINHLTTAPRFSLRPGQLLVNEPVERLRLFGITAATPVLQPATRQPVSIVEGTDASKAAGVGVMTWDALEHVALCLSEELRRHAAGLLQGAAVKRALERLTRTHPTLTAVFTERFSAACLCQVLRELLADEVSVRSLPQILAAMLDCDFIVADEVTQIIFDERLALTAEPRTPWPDTPATLAASVRRALKRSLSHRYSRGQAALPVYLLAPELESRLAAHGRGASTMAEADISRLLSIVEDKIPAGRDNRDKVILTTTFARRPMRQILAQRRPWLPVVAYQELAPELNLQPLGRLEWSA